MGNTFYTVISIGIIQIIICFTGFGISALTKKDPYKKWKAYIGCFGCGLFFIMAECWINIRNT